ncbi:MAG: DUF2249 domain-containing protein [Opitutales bacterium]|nr:DUF2249 domain-containing protein [Opitutales bacterium]
MNPNRLDVSKLPCESKLSTIFQQWSELKKGESFVLVNGFDPAPLRMQFERLYPGAHKWEYLKEGPDNVEIRITKTGNSSSEVAFSCCSGDESVDDNDDQPKQIRELDVRGHEPPVPMMRIIEALETLHPDCELHATTDRRPMHLQNELLARGVSFESFEQHDGSWLNIISK